MSYHVNACTSREEILSMWVAGKASPDDCLHAMACLALQAARIKIKQHFGGKNSKTWRDPELAEIIANDIYETIIPEMAKDHLICKVGGGQ